MPTSTGLPRVGEVWERTYRAAFGETHSFRFVVLERGRGDYWSLRGFIPGQGKSLWVDASYWLKQGELRYIGPAGPKTRKALGLG